MKSDFKSEFNNLTGFPPFKWQSRLYAEYFASGMIPAAVDIPTGLGKTSVMALWYLALSKGASLPRRMVYVVDRRAVVDQATTVADEIKSRSTDQLRVSTLRGQHVDNREWLEDPTAPAIIVGTVDMIGSRLLFTGYGVSQKMRAYHAGLLGADALIVLDESHLVPPFERLLNEIETGEKAFAPCDKANRAVVPAFRLLSLSATGRARNGAIFRLEEKNGDLDDSRVKTRLDARKRLRVEPANGKNPEEVLAEQAWKFTNQGKKAIRVIVYCHSRDVAEKTKKAVEGKAKGDKKNGIPPTDINEPELFVGARRVKERVDAAETLKTLGFLAGSDVQLKEPAFLIATSAGEVGVDLDADHMVCDLVPWERMVQRLGRVNRLGNGNARIILVQEDEPELKKPDKPKPEEVRAIIAWRCLQLLNKLPKSGSSIDVSPRTLMNLKQRAAKEAKLQELIDAATTPPPLYPELSRALVDAWSMTSLEEHTGRPEVAPWLRGWVEDEAPQTAVVWRKYLPVRLEGGEASRKEIEAFFEAAPPHLSEKLETETWRVVDWLIKRAKLRKTTAGGTNDDNIVLFVLAPDGDLRMKLHLHDLIKISDNKEQKKELLRDLAEMTLIVDTRLGGLRDGLLNYEAAADEVRTADDGDAWPVDTGFHILESAELSIHGDITWRESFRFDVERSAEGESLRTIIIEGQNEERQAESRNPQLLDEHLKWTGGKARTLAKAIGLSNTYTQILVISARLHDEGKKAVRWQRAFNAEQDDIYAKTKGPFSRVRLGGYRHEFGSLSFAELDEAFKALSSDQKELVLHLVAAHHGRARPLIETEGCDDAPPSLLESRACDVALRFARLQKAWGPWGLAWWESLLRAADQQASRENELKKKVAIGRS